jgi:uroporphyrinogen III methyltransferase/synthase
MGHHGRDPLPRAIGAATRNAIELLHLKVDLIGQEFVAESLVEAFRSIDLEGKRVLLPRAAVARDILPRELRARGACVDVVEAYRTVVPESAARQAADLFSGRKISWITFTSSSTAQNFVQVAGTDVLRGVNVASIGPVTTATAKNLGVTVTVEARVFTTDGLVEAILHHRS